MPLDLVATGDLWVQDFSGLRKIETPCTQVTLLMDSYNWLYGSDIV